METVCFFETFVPTNKTTRHNKEGQRRHRQISRRLTVKGDQLKEKQKKKKEDMKGRK
jgi:hypothetical protein